MYIKKLKAASALHTTTDARVVLELTARETQIIGNALYRYITGGKNGDKEVRNIYSDWMVIQQLMETGRLDDWTVERVQDYRGDQYTPVKGDDNL